MENLTGKMTKFINVSNHMSCKWSDAQITAAKKWGEEIIDIPFPQVPPDATVREIYDMANKLIDKIISYGTSVVVHIMGESGLLFATVLSLLEQYPGIALLHSTTERKVVERVKEDGTTERTSVFQFVQFRPYY